jgi:hypothetical protein
VSAVNRAPIEVAPRLGTLAVAWTLSRQAAAPAFKHLAPGDGEVELRWLIDLGASSSTLLVIDGAVEHRIATGGAAPGWDPETGLMHLHAAAGQDELVATLRDDAVLYARTTVMERLGIAGGRYEVVRTAVQAPAVTRPASSAAAC